MALLFMNAAVANKADGMKLVRTMFGQSAITSVQDKIDQIKNLPPDEQEKAIRDALEKYRRGK